MKKIAILLLSVVILSACNDKKMRIEVINPSALDKTNEMVEVSWQTISQGLGLSAEAAFVVLDEQGKQVTYQVITKGLETNQSVIFPATVKAGEKATFSFKAGQPEPFAPRVFGRHVPERKDDFAWENDRIAFRMYGPALADENPSNGVDTWLKCTDELIMERFYKEDLSGEKSYHVDHGEGLDCYKVGHTLGAGGISPYFNDTLWVGNHYDSSRVLDNGPLRFTFELTYNTIPVSNKGVKAVLRISLDAYSQLNKAEVVYSGDADVTKVAGGIFLHDIIGVTKTDVAAGYIAYAENAVSDAGLAAGRNYIGVVMPGMKEAKQDDTHLLAIADYSANQPYTYYFGAGWNKWGFETDDAWFNYMADYAKNVQQPLQVNVLSK